MLASANCEGTGGALLTDTMLIPQGPQVQTK